MSAFKKSFQYGPHTVTIETGEVARQADGLRRRLDGRYRRAGHRRCRQEGGARPGLLPADGQLRREDLRRGPHPRRLLQARRPPDRKRDADFAPHRSPDPSAVSRRLLQRSTGRGARCCRMDPDIDADIPALLGASAALVAGRRAVRRPDRRRARRLQGRQVPVESRPARSSPTRSCTWSSPAPRRRC